MTDQILAKQTVPEKILVIENDLDLLDLLKEILSSEGFQVFCYQECEDIISLSEEVHPDVIIVDYLLPGINGGELCAQIKHEPKTRHIPVIIFSAYPQVLLSLGTYGCNAFIPKPFELVALLGQIKNCLKNPSEIFTGNKLERKIQ